MSFAALLLLAGSAARGADAKPPATPSADPAGVEFFETKIRPVLAENCYSCHSAAAAKLKGKLFLDSRDGILKGGESDLPAIVPGNLEDSTLIRAIRQEDDGLSMPPKKKLAAEQIAAFEQWVKIGAPMPATFVAAPAKAQATTQPHGMTLADGRKHWSFKPPQDHEVPPGVSAVDYFVNARLAAAGLTQSPRADKRTLIRRATFDLTGLPPTIQEIESFEADESPNAFEKVVDRLLASPRYGERWGRYWLDVARYADTKGYVFEEERRYPFSYTYRDWVIRAFNEDLPYDQFLIQQIAADRLEPKEDKRPLAALGFLTLGRRFLNNQPDIIDDRIDVVCRGTMALTVSCARCHDHKYDPIPTADYYSLYGVFASSTEPAELPSIGGEKPAQAAEFEAELAKRRGELESFSQAKHAEYLAAIRQPVEIARYLLAAQKNMSPPELAFETVDDGKSLNPHVVKRWQRYLKEQADAKDTLFAAWRRYAAIPHDKFEAQAAEVTKQIRAAATENALVTRFVAATPPKTIDEVAERYGKLLASFASDSPAPDVAIEQIRLAVRGENSPTSVTLAKADRLFNVADGSRQRQLQQRIDELIATHPGAPQKAMAMADLPQPVEPTIFKRGNPGMAGAQVPRQFPAILSGDDRKPFNDGGSGRLALAKSIASKDNPLTARVMVNRVWQYHFGAGLVRTPSDFGTRGETPTHPELLDYLALRFVNEDGWSIKRLHRRLMLSQTYQQSSTATPSTGTAEKDPENRLLWRMNPRRLDVEAMRDSLLATSGALDPKMGGRPVDIFAQPFVPRRTVYAFIDRQNLPGHVPHVRLRQPRLDQRPALRDVGPAAVAVHDEQPVRDRAVAQTRRAGGGHGERRCEAARDDALPPCPRSIADQRRAGSRHEVRRDGRSTAEAGDGRAKPSPLASTATANSTSRRSGCELYPLPHFTGEQWQGRPDASRPKLGWVMLTRSGGHAGNDQATAVVRRWTAPRDCTISRRRARCRTTRRRRRRPRAAHLVARRDAGDVERLQQVRRHQCSAAFAEARRHDGLRRRHAAAANDYTRQLRLAGDDHEGSRRRARRGRRHRRHVELRPRVRRPPDRTPRTADRVGEVRTGVAGVERVRLWIEALCPVLSTARVARIASCPAASSCTSAAWAGRAGAGKPARRSRRRRADGRRPNAPINPLSPSPRSFPAKRNASSHLRHAGPSQVDTFDPKPSLDKYAGKAAADGVPRDRAENGAAMRRRSSSRSTARAG
jgi:hypothetical protein